ncbi:Putative amidoligase enzyme [Desulfomicrobium apsheronum]|uniref:Putative amidoligase enzyme n=1 Tax=Desulfomicrobium apsheronum TaxID=52560 RepID=A0A1I3ZGB5_9BACT|nr:amidoligase family protein [Desulfomicrobium apsheronum]SFK43097.1 Putative amidoligase enzyme [Desulfomicrobium apsheronum]
MHDEKHKLKQPPWLKNAEGQMRRVGVELEISGLELDALAGCVAEFLGLRMEATGRYERLLTGDAAGDWVVELDFDLLKKLGREPHMAGAPVVDFGRTAEDVLAWAAELLVPLEIISPPLPLTRLHEVEALIVRLRAAGAKGTSDSIVNAFGMQFNPELPSFEPELITASLKAFLCLYDWLFERADIDLSRRVTSYVNPFPAGYVEKVIAADYLPGLATLIDDYLAYNPTRNRALDMLPLFMFLDEKRVRAKADDVLIKARPTFHYRLPDCDIHKPEWGLYVAWNDWVEVERLAADNQRLEACCAAYLEYLDDPLQRLFGDWPATVEREWLGR